ncbi:MAG: AsmA family protein [Pseudomonadota bacterium]|nr:AsmA family protein [Pseudomonadota bacterium]
MTDIPARRRRWPYVVGAFFLALIAAVFAFQWDWLIPLVESRASAALGRPVKLAHLHVTLGRVTHIVADEVTIGNPVGWKGGGDFAAAEHLVVDIEISPLLHGRHVVLPLVALERPNVDAQQLADRSANWGFSGGSTSQSADGATTGPQIGKLVINDGRVHVRSAPLAADFEVTIGTASEQGADRIVASAKGTYAKQPITAEFTGGALLSLRDTKDPYPVNLRLTNGPTTASAVGTVSHPLTFSGADVKLEIVGPNMALLLPLTGIAIPATPPYRVAGKLDYGAGVVKFDDFNGKVGSSDLAGSIGVDTKPERPVVTANLQSRMVELKDLGGFIGADPAKTSKAAASSKVLPNDPISVPRLTAADVHLTYKARRIEGRRQPLDDMQAALDIVNGDVTLHPLSFGIGRGKIVSQIRLGERASGVDAHADIDFQRVDVSKLLNATGVARGAGTIGGRAVVEGSGKSLAEILGRGNGELRLYMGSGGNLSALLVDLSGLQFGNALLSALGIPNRAQIECLVTDFVLKNGEAESRLTMLDTNEARIGITGGISFKTEALKLVLRTESKHFSIGSLPTPIDLGGTMGSPSIQPELAEAGTRAAAAVGLGIVLTPLAALLPTIQTGTGEDGACAGLLREIKAPPRTQADAPAPRRRR